MGLSYATQIKCKQNHFDLCETRTKKIKNKWTRHALKHRAAKHKTVGSKSKLPWNVELFQHKTFFLVN